MLSLSQLRMPLTITQASWLRYFLKMTMINTEQKRAVIYCRVSTKEQVEEGNSLATQEKICKDYALKQGYQIAETFIEQGESAKTTNRSELQRLIYYCSLKKNRVSVLIAYKLDRISRNTYDYNQIKFLLKRYGVDVKSTTEYFEDTPAGRFMENIISNVAQFDNDVRTERSIGGMRDACRDGRYVWMAPVGYDNVKIGGKSTIKPNGQAPLVSKAFQEVAKNLVPVEEVRRRIIKDGLVSRYGKPITRSYFYTILRNQIYTGTFSKLGELHQGLYEPIISKDLFEQVQRVLRHRKYRNHAYLRENPDFPLRRFIIDETSCKLQGYWSTGRSKKYPYYIFRGSKTNFKRDDLENEFVKFLDSFQFNDEHFELLQKKVQEHLDMFLAGNVKESSRLESLITELKVKQSSLIQKNLKGVIPDHILSEQLNSVENEIMKYYSLFQSLPKPKQSYERLLVKLKEYLKTPGKTWRRAGFKRKLALQWFYFPKGLHFDGLKLQTIEMCSIFKAENAFFYPKSIRVPSNNKTTNQVDVPLKDDWLKIGKEIEDLFEIYENGDNPPSLTI